MNNDKFRVDMGRWAKETSAKLEGIARVACQDLAEEVVDTTPIDLGFLVGNWQPSLGAPLLAEDKQGSGNGYAQSKISLTITQLKVGQTFYCVNNAAYARRIEYGFVGADSLGRVYNQKGRHMVTNAVAKWDKIVDRAAVKVGVAKGGVRAK